MNSWGLCRSGGSLISPYSISGCLLGLRLFLLLMSAGRVASKGSAFVHDTERSDVPSLRSWLKRLRLIQLSQSIVASSCG